MWKVLLSVSALLIAVSIGYYLNVYIPNLGTTEGLTPLEMDSKNIIKQQVKTSKLEEKVELLNSNGNPNGEMVTIREMYRRSLFDSISIEDRKELTEDDIKAFCTNKTKKSMSYLETSNTSLDEAKSLINISFRICLSENDQQPYDLL